jgi:DNA polymerase III epsilon subunit-like protein
MNFNYLLVYDYETGSRNKHNTQLTQIASIVIEPRKLVLVENSLFSSEVKPILDDAAAIEAGLAPIDEEALRITHKTRENLAKAPELKQVWESWMESIAKYRTNRGGAWGSPIPCGFNINKFDNFITDRYAEQFGQWDKTWETNTVFHPLVSYDLLVEFWKVAENIKINNNHSISLDAIRDWLGMTKEGAHDAKNDVIDCAELVIRFLRMHRKMNVGFECTKCQTPLKVRFEGSLASWKRPVF